MKVVDDFSDGDCLVVTGDNNGNRLLGHEGSFGRVKSNRLVRG